jgi:molybdenum-dependent DNA-binding transcriptional regulator ModE
MLRPQVKIELAREEVFLTPDAALLLRLISRTESVRTACRQVNLSYSKGWMILNQMEKQLDFPSSSVIRAAWAAAIRLSPIKACGCSVL